MSKFQLGFVCFQALSLTFSGFEAKIPLAGVCYSLIDNRLLVLVRIVMICLNLILEFVIGHTSKFGWGWTVSSISMLTNVYWVLVALCQLWFGHFLFKVY